MQTSKPGKFIKLIIVVAAALTMCLIKVGVSASQSQEPVNIVPFGSSVAEKLGNDDGAALIVHFSGDIHGNLDVCTCKGRLLGGMARRVSFSKLFKEKYKDVPVLLVDTGGFLMDRTGEHGFLRNFTLVRDRWTLQGYEKYGYSVANLSQHELPYLASLASSGEGLPQSSGAELLPLVSANLAANEIGRKLGIKPYLIVNAEAATGPHATKAIKVAFVGLSDSPETTEGAGALAPVFKVTDPVEAAKRFVREARSKADIVVVLAHLPASKAIEVAHSVPDIDVLISGNEQEFTRPFRVGKTLMLFTSYETHSIGEVRFYPSAEGGFTAKQRFISLDTGMVDDPEATKFVADMVAEVKESTKRFSEGTTSQQPPSQGSPAQKPVFAGSAECSKCHTTQYMTWLNSPHAHATTSLAPKADELEVGCFVCHTTGFGKGGFVERGLAMMKFSNVQCEQCHGPALEHIAKPDKSYGKISNVSAMCGTCHTAQTSPEFKYTSAWEAIKH